MCSFGANGTCDKIHKHYSELGSGHELCFVNARVLFLLAKGNFVKKNILNVPGLVAAILISSISMNAWASESAEFFHPATEQTEELQKSWATVSSDDYFSGEQVSHKTDSREETKVSLNQEPLELF